MSNLILPNNNLVFPRRKFMSCLAAAACMTISERAKAAKFSDYYSMLSVKDPAFGATGDGSTDDRAAIQACIDAAFGTAASPHGNTNRFLNKSVYFPAGNYKIGGPLYLTFVVGGKIIGAGQNSTRLFYSGSYSGNTVVANGLTPLIMTNGVSYSVISDLNLSMAVNTSIGLYLYQDGTKGTTTGNLIENIVVDTCTNGILIGYQSNALCSEQLFLNCVATSCTDGFVNLSQNALNNNFINCGAANNTGHGFTCQTGNIVISGASLATNAVYDVQVGQSPMTIIGSRTESANFVKFSSSNVAVYISGCVQAGGAGAGAFVDVGNSNKAIMDACVATSTTATEGLISGTTGSKIYLRGCDFRNTHYLDAFTGTVGQNI